MSLRACQVGCFRSLRLSPCRNVEPTWRACLLCSRSRRSLRPRRSPRSLCSRAPLLAACFCVMATHPARAQRTTRPAGARCTTPALALASEVPRRAPRRPNARSRDTGFDPASPSAPSTSRLGDNTKNELPSAVWCSDLAPVFGFVFKRLLLRNPWPETRAPVGRVAQRPRKDERAAPPTSC